jgi:lipoic acid synthetase
MILGDICTRNCNFCAVKQGSPNPLDPNEPHKVAQAVKDLKLHYAVITSVTRDDLPDGGAAVFSQVITEIHFTNPLCTIEVLIPDFQGNRGALSKVIAAQPEVINHNLETVPRLYSKVRPQANYQRSLSILAEVKRQTKEVVTKSGLILGLGETKQEIIETLKDLRKVDCDLLTLGQYLQPGPDKLPVVRYLLPEEFQELKRTAEEMGFRGVEAGPLVRSSYRAEAQIPKG